MKALDKDFRNWLNAEEDITAGTAAPKATDAAGNEEDITESKWYQVTDSILGFADAGVDIWNDITNGTNTYDHGTTPKPSGGTEVSFGREDDNSGKFILYGGIALVAGLVIYSVVRMNKKD